MSKRKLLLADDSITIQKVVNLTFADEGIEVISVGDGDSAMRKFDEFMPDLVMADVNMPGLSGYEVCRIIKRTEETQDIPVILLVGSFEPFDEAEAKDAGADDFLTKPFQSIRQLVNKVTDLLNQREQPPETAADEAENAPIDQFAETLRFESQTEAPGESSYQAQEIGSEYGDAGMDDEMIEASPANDYLSAAESAFQPDTDFGKTQPLNSEDLKGFDIVPPGASAGQQTPVSFEDQETATEETEETEQTPPARAEAASFDEEARKLGYFPSYEPDDRPEISETEPEIDYYLPEGGDEEHGEQEFDKEITDAETLEPEVSYAPEEPREADFSQATVEETTETETETAETSGPQETEETPETPSGFRELEYAEYYKTAEEPEAETAETAEESQETPETRFDEELEIEAVEEPETIETVEAETAAAPQFESAVSETTEVSETPATFETPEIPTEAPVAAASSDAPTFASFDDGDLLELPPLVEETGIRPQPKMPPIAPAEPVAAEPEVSEVSEAAETEETTEASESPLPAEAAQAFPPELIEAIAQKVAEKISAKTMSDVLPQITELVMKKLAEEKSEDKN